MDNSLYKRLQANYMELISHQTWTSRLDAHTLVKTAHQHKLLALLVKC